MIWLRSQGWPSRPALTDRTELTTSLPAQATPCPAQLPSARLRMVRDLQAGRSTSGSRRSSHDAASPGRSTT